MECIRCGNETDGDDEPLNKKCDYCKKLFDILSLCRSCYCKHYPLRLCNDCITAVEEI